MPGGEINTGSGNHSYQVQDLSVPTVGGTLTFERTYASQHANDAGVLGFGWTHNYNMHLEWEGGYTGTIVIVTPDGSRLRYYYDYAEGHYSYFSPYPGAQGQLVWVLWGSANYYAFTDTAQMVYVFPGTTNIAGKLASVDDPQGHRTTLAYDNDNRLSQVTGPDGHSITFTYDLGRLQRVCDHTNRCVGFTYNSQTGDLETATDVRGYVWHYTYPSAHLLEEVRDANNHLVEKTEYDGQGRAWRQWSGDAANPTLEIEFVDATTRVVTDALGNAQIVSYDARNTWTGSRDASGVTTTRTYDAHFNLNYLQDGNGNPTAIDWSDCGCRPEVITDALDYETHMRYNEHNNLISTTDALNHTTLYTYSNDTIRPDIPPNLLIETRDALGHHTYYDYSPGPTPPPGLLIWTKDTLNRETRNQYDAYGQVLSTAALSGGVWITTTTYAYDALGRQIRVEDALGHVAMTYYDGGGYITRTVENCTAGSYEACSTVPYSAVFPDENIVTRYAYDGIGNRTRVTNTLGIVTAYEYDASNRLVQVTENSHDGRYSPDYPDEDITTTYGYDDAGNQVAVTDSQGIATRTFYDELNRPYKVVANYTGSGQFDPNYPDRNVTTYYGYDPAGNQVTVTNPLGVKTVTRYDDLNRPYKVIANYIGSGEYDPNYPDRNVTTRYGYDAVGNQVAVTDTRGVVTFYEYDGLNRLTATKENHVQVPGLSGPLDVTTEYGYNAAGQQAWVRNARDVTTRYVYDDLGRQVEVWENFTLEPLGTGDENIRTRYRYDLLGNRTRVIDHLDTVTRYEYDGLNRLITTTANYGAGIHSADRNVVTVNHYDGLGRRTAVVDDHDVVTRYDYDDLGRLVKAWENYLEPVVYGNDVNVVTSFAYDRHGNRTQMTDPGNNVTSYEYDALSRMTAVTDPLTHRTVYAYDCAGNQVMVTDANGNATHYTYNALGRAVAVEDALDNTTTYGYDAAGNRTLVTDAEGITTRYDYDALSRLVAVTENDAPGMPGDADTNVVTAYDYDLLGNLLTVTNALDHVTHYTYDALSRLKTESDPMDHTWRYGYNALGWRTAMTDSMETITRYDYDALGRLRSTKYSEEFEIGYGYDSLGHRVAMTDTTGVTRYGFDDLGRVTALTHTVGEQLDYGIGYRYNARRLRTGLVYPDGSVISYTYDAAARLTTVLEDATTYAFYHYDPAGRLVTATLGNGARAVYAYDQANRMTGITHQKIAVPQAELLARYAYSYDRVGNRTRAVETVISGGGGQAWVPGEEWLAQNLPLLTPGSSGASLSGQRGGLSAPLPQQPPIVRERDRYRASFDEEGLRFYPRHPLLADTGYHVAYRLTVVRRGNDVVLHPGHDVPVLVNEDLVQYWRGDTFAEEYALAEGGVEQRFIFLAPLSGTGDLVIEGNLTGDLQPVLQASTGEIVFPLPGTDEVLASYGRAVVEDAAGRRLAARLELDGAHLRIVVPGEWLAQAIYPVVVDPLIGVNFAVATQEVLSNQAQSAAANAGETASLVVWATSNGGSGWDISGQLVSAEGQLLSPTITVTAGADNQQYPAAAGNTTDGSYLVVWQSYSAATGWDVHGQVVSRAGALVGQRLDLCTLAGNQTAPALAYDGTSNRYLVTWQAADGIYSLLRNGDGSPAGDPARLSTAGNSWASPDVTFNAVTSQYLVVWQSWGMLGSDLAGRLVSVDGVPQGDNEIAITSSPGVIEGNPAVAAEAIEGRYLVVYQAPNDQGRSNVYGQALYSTTALLGLPFAIAGGPATQGSPDVTYGAALQEHLVTWETTSAVGQAYDIHGRRVRLEASGGVPAGDEVTIYDGAADQRYPALLYNGVSGEYLTVWEDARLGGDWDIYARRVAADSSPLGADFLVSSVRVSTAQDQTAVAYGSQQGLYLVAWRDRRNGNDDIYGQMVAPGGALVGPAILIATTGVAEVTPAVAYNPTADQFLVVWQQAGTDLYALRVSGAGVIQGNPFVLNNGAGTQAAPAVAFNTAAGPAGEWLAVWEDGGGVNYDLYGQRVDTNGLVGGVIAVWTDGAQPRYPDIAAAGAGGYLVVWEEQGANPAKVYGLFLDHEGNRVGAPMGIPGSDRPQKAPAVAYGATETRYLVTWQEEEAEEEGAYDVRGCFVAPTGMLSPFGVAEAAGVTEEAPDVACGEAVGEWAVAWQVKSATTGYDVRWGSLDASGALLGGTETLTAVKQNQQGVALAYDSGRSRYLAVWADYRDSPTTPHVYAQLARGYSLVVDYTYDDLYRLTGAAYSDGADYGYAYDAVGNRTRYTDTTAPVALTTYAYDDADRLTAVTRAGVPTLYSWSDRGELLSDGVQSYRWDAAGRLQRVTDTQGLDVRYTYDGANNRVAMAVNGAATAYVVDPFSPVDGVAQVLRETTGEQRTRNLYGLDLFAQQQGEATTYLGYDALSVRLHVDEAGALFATYRYGPFGEVVGGGPAGYGYTGEQWQSNVGLLYLRARYYAPEMGRFVSRDSPKGEMDHPMTLHRYAYVTNRPVFLRDPSGQQIFTPMPSLLDLYKTQQLDLEDVTPASIEARWPNVRLMDADWKYGCLPDPDAYHWSLSERYGAFETFYLGYLSWSVQAISGVGDGDALVRLMAGLRWWVLRSQPNHPSGTRGGQTVGRYEGEVVSFFYGSPYWSKLNTLESAQDTFFHEFGHVWDITHLYLFNIGLNIGLPNGSGDPEIWAAAFKDALHFRADENAIYARDRIRFAPYEYQGYEW